MATKRQRPSGTWEFTVKRKGILPRPVSLTFDTEDEGDAYCAKLEALLDQGIIPDGLFSAARPQTIGDAIRDFLLTHTISQADREYLAVSLDRIGHVPLSQVAYKWAEDWIAGMKRVDGLSPSTIRHHVGALARCFDALGRRDASMAVNPLRMLPKGYSSYSQLDTAAALESGRVAKHDSERDRRLQPGEEDRIRFVLGGGKPEGRERAFDLPYQGALECLFDLALETAMRMSEAYTLSLVQVDIAGRSIYLEKTKNGDKRSVPLTTVAIAALTRYLEQVAAGDRGMAGFRHEGGMLFPWWDGTDVGRKTITNRLSRQYARIFLAAGCPDLHYHDLRHEATSRLFERTTLDPVSISRITGHRDPRQLRRYTNLRSSDLAARLW